MVANVQEVVRRLTIESIPKGVSESVDKLRALRGEMEAVTVTSQRQEKATQTMERRLASIQKQYDANYRAEQALARVTRDLNAAEAQGLITAARKNELLTLATAKHAQAATATTAHARSLMGLNAAGIGAVSMLSRLLLPLTAGLAGAATGRTFITNTVEQENVMAQLEARIRSTGAAAGYNARELAEMASSLQRVTTYDDEAIISSQGLLLSFTRIGHDVFPRATRAILDTATALHTDLDSATKLIGKALNDPIKGLTALSRAGVVFTDQQKAQIKTMVESGRVTEAQALALAELERRFGGSAAAARDTLGGALAGLKNSFGDLFEVAGPGADRLTASINQLTETLSDPKTIAAIQNFGSHLFGAFATTLNLLSENPWLAKILGGAVAGAAVGSLGGVPGVAIGALGGAVGTAGYGLGQSLGNMAIDAIPGARDFANVNRAGKGDFGGPAWDRSAFDMGSFYNAFGTTFGKSAAGGGGGPTEDQIREAERLQKAFDRTMASAAKQTAALNAQIATFGMSASAAAEYTKQQELLNAATENQISLTPSVIASINEQAEAYGKATGELERLNIAQGLVKDFVGSLTSDLRNGVSAFDALGNAATRLTDKLIDMALDQAINSLFSTLVGSLGSVASSGGAAGAPWSAGAFDSANGNVFAGGNVIPFRSGGIVSRPSIFPMANGGIGSMAENEPEAIMPLKRGPSGRLGVEMHGGGMTAPGVQINITNNGEPVQARETGRSFDGRNMVVDLVLDTLSNGKADKAMAGRYGARPKLRGRGG